MKRLTLRYQPQRSFVHHKFHIYRKQLLNFVNYNFEK
jgi:hypothetical protein